MINPLTRAPQLDPVTGAPLVVHDRLATSTSNFLFLGPVPVFYWPTLATNLEKPTYFLDKLRVRNDSIFGTSLLTSWDIYQLFGIQNAPAGTDWNLNVDYLSDRGLGFGSSFEYQRESFLTVPGPTVGFLDTWFINEHDFDTLGSDRLNVPPEAEFPRPNPVATPPTPAGRLPTHRRGGLDFGSKLP